MKAFNMNFLLMKYHHCVANLLDILCTLASTSDKDANFNILIYGAYHCI